MTIQDVFRVTGSLLSKDEMSSKIVTPFTQLVGAKLRSGFLKELVNKKKNVAG